MSIGGYKIRNKEAIHFVTFAVIGWVDVFTRKQYCDIFIDNLRYCQEHKGLLLHCWCLMSNHAHLIVSARNKDTSEILRDFKKHTAKKIIGAIEQNTQESRKEWMLSLFRQHGVKNSRNTNYQFWRQDNQPKELYSPAFIHQKIRYIHENPVRAGIVELPEHYLNSSARDYHLTKRNGLLHIDFI